MMFYEEQIIERRIGLLKCWPSLQMERLPILIGGAIERSKTELPADFVPWAPWVVIASDYLLREVGYRPGSSPPNGWTPGQPGVFTKVWNRNRLMVRQCGEYWTVERSNDEVLAYFSVPMFTRTCQSAMQLAEYCQPHALEGESRAFPRPRGVASGLRWVPFDPEGIKWC